MKGSSTNGWLSPLCCNLCLINPTHHVLLDDVSEGTPYLEEPPADSQSCWESRTDMDCDGLFGRCGQICCVAYMLSTYTTKRKNVTWSGYQLSRTLPP